MGSQVNGYRQVFKDSIIKIPIISDWFVDSIQLILKLATFGF